MGATSVTGTGLGAATNKGPQNNRNNFIPLTDPRILAAGIATCDGTGVADIRFPTPLPGGVGNHAIIATGSSFAINEPVRTGGAYDENDELVQISILGEPDVAYYYAVISSGQPTL